MSAVPLYNSWRTNLTDSPAFVPLAHELVYYLAGARAAELPIGSGEVESGHKHVLQKRLKIAGAWWREPNVEFMLQLRTVRANGDWDKYWNEVVKN